MSEETASSQLPKQVLDVLKETTIGYLSVINKKGDLYSYPVSFHYSDNRIYLITPVSSAKLKFIRGNPNVSFIVDNKKLTTEACGAMVQGKAKVFSMGKLVTSIISMGPKVVEYVRKYPSMLGFYVIGKQLPPERKFYKYRVVRIDVTKVVYWTGYVFGRYVPVRPKEASKAGLDLKDETGVGRMAGLVESADEELEMDQLPKSEDWLEELKSAAKGGLISEAESRVIGAYGMAGLGLEGRAAPGNVTGEEKDFLKKWKASSSK